MPLGRVGGEEVRGQAPGVEVRAALEDVRGVVAGARVQQAHEVRGARDGADGGAGPARGGALLEGDGGRHAGHRFDARIPGAADQAAGERGDRFEVAALRLAVDGPEGERGLPGAGDAGEGHQPAAGQAHRDIAQVVQVGAADPHPRVLIDRGGSNGIPGVLGRGGNGCWAGRVLSLTPPTPSSGCRTRGCRRRPARGRSPSA